MNRKNKTNIKTDTGKAEEIYQERGCGYKVLGAYYLLGSGLGRECDALPIPLDPCSECGFEVGFTRGVMSVHIHYLRSKLKDHYFVEDPLRTLEKNLKCKCSPSCPICFPLANLGTKFFLMFVSSKHYTPRTFKIEAERLGVSKRIAPHTLPKDFKMGKSWILLAHNKVVDEQYFKHPKRAIFYAFRPTQIQVVLDKKTPEAELKKYRKQGFTPVLVDPKKLRRPKK